MPDLTFEDIASIPSSVRCGTCGETYGAHSGDRCLSLDARDVYRSLPQPCYDDDRTDGRMELRPQDEYEALRATVAALYGRQPVTLTATPRPTPDLLPVFCAVPMPGRMYGTNVCARRFGHNGQHVRPFDDGSAFTWNEGDTRAQSEGEGAYYTMAGERDDARAALDCSYCDERGHNAADCPVAEEDNRGGDDLSDDSEYDTMDNCSCANCIAASQYVGPVE